MEIKKYRNFAKIISPYNITINQAWMFVCIAKFIKSHIDSYSTERLLWSFCTEYFEDDDLKELSHSVSKDSNIELEIDDKSDFPYKIGVPIKAQVTITIDDAEFYSLC